MLLDLGLPDMDGQDVCRSIRSDSQIPIIVISARGDEVDKVVGLELGLMTTSQSLSGSVN